MSPPHVLQFLVTVGLRYIKKFLASLSMQLGSCVLKAHTHVPYVPDVRAIMGLQDVRTDGVIITHRTCGYVSYSTTPTLLVTRGTLL
jgi:hypothetical protein